MDKTGTKILTKEEDNDNIKDFQSGPIIKSFFLKHQNPCLIISHNNFENQEIKLLNHSCNEFFQKTNEYISDYESFINLFSFLSKPINILASLVKIKALHKKTGNIFYLTLHHINNEFVIIEMQVQEFINETHRSITKEKEYHELVNLLPEIVFELNKDYTFTFLNQAALNELGFTNDDLKSGIHIKNIILKKDFGKFETYLKSVFDGKSIREKEFSIIKADGKPTRVEVYFTVIKQGIKIKGIRGIAIDITHRKKIEDRLIVAKQRAEDADKLKTSFLMNMSHEIRTPLNSVLGYSQLLLRKEKDETHINYLQNIISSGKGLLQLFNDLIDLSKIYSGQLDIMKIETSLNTMLDKLAKDFKLEIGLKKKNISLSVYKGLADSQSNVLVDEERLKQVFYSLLNNSLKFTTDGLIEFGYHQVEKKLLFFIKDSGIGIDKKIQKDIFDFFNRPAFENIEHESGLGIGLAITRGIIEKMDGNIWLESEPGKGSLFNFTIPYETAKSEIKRNTEEDIDPDFSGKTILIVEDDLNNYLILESFLENTCARLIHADNGKDAVLVCKNEPVDIVLMDINIPEIDGCEATSMIKKLNKNIQIVAQSAYVFNEDKTKCYQAGCDIFLEKPINYETLMATISGLLALKR